jgi:hypothetical protein
MDVFILKAQNAPSQVIFTRHRVTFCGDLKIFEITLAAMPSEPSKEIWPLFIW